MRKRKPKFGDWMRNAMCTDSNPRHTAQFVRIISITGRVNPGTWYQMTDGEGDFWLSDPQSLEFMYTLEE